MPVAAPWPVLAESPLKPRAVLYPLLRPDQHRAHRILSREGDQRIIAQEAAKAEAEQRCGQGVGEAWVAGGRGRGWGMVGVGRNGESAFPPSRRDTTNESPNHAAQAACAAGKRL